MAHRKLAALDLIWGVPAWPKRDLLSPAGMALFDAICDGAKALALDVVDGEFGKALVVASAWGRLANAFVDTTLIDDEREDVREANHRMLRVFSYYAGSVADLGKVAG